jgi:hypothetical protein
MDLFSTLGNGGNHDGGGTFLWLFIALLVFILTFF